MIRSMRALTVGVAILVALAGIVPTWGAELVAEDVTVTLTPFNPPIVIPDGGGDFAFTLQVENHAATPLAFNVWTTYTLPDDQGTEPGYGPVDLLLPGAWSAEAELTQAIPAGMPPGSYTYTALAGTYPDDVWSTDDFTFEKLPGSAGWYAQSPATDVGINGISFVDANTGWAVTRYLEIIHTTNGGDTWQHQEDPQNYYEYSDVHFVDTQTGWVVGDAYSAGGIILHTSDGGTSWTEQEPYYGYALSKVFFTDPDYGWTVGGYSEFLGDHGRIIEHTTDGGQTWVGQLLQGGQYGFASVHCWAVGSPGAILHTENGGDSWSSQNSGTTSDLRDVYFVDANIGWCVGADGTVLHTTDGGSHWNPQVSGTGAELMGVCFHDADTGWIAGTEWTLVQPVILKTEDGGLTWQQQNPGTGSDTASLSDIDFVDAYHGWAAGTLIAGGHEHGEMLHTENGGGGTVTGIASPLSPSG